MTNPVTPEDPTGRRYSREPVLITGSGMVACRERDAHSVWSRVLADERIQEGLLTRKELVGLAGVDSGDARILGRHQLLAMAVTEQAWREA